MTNGEKIQQDFKCEVCEPIIEDNIIHVIFADKPDSAIGFDYDWWNAEYKEPTIKNALALLERTYDDFCSCEGGEGWLKIDGKEYGTDAGYAIEGVDIFMEVFKRRLAELPSVTPIRPKGHWIPVRVDRYSEQYGHFKINEYKCSNCNSEFEYGYHNYCPYCGARMVEPQESEVEDGNDNKQ